MVSRLKDTENKDRLLTLYKSQSDRLLGLYEAQFESMKSLKLMMNNYDQCLAQKDVQLQQKDRQLREKDWELRDKDRQLELLRDKGKDRPLELLNKSMFWHWWKTKT